MSSSGGVSHIVDGECGGGRADGDEGADNVGQGRGEWGGSGCAGDRAGAREGQGGCLALLSVFGLL